MFIAFRLKPGRDDDLIAWISSLGRDERSCNIRQALRGVVFNAAPVNTRQAPGKHHANIMPKAADAKATENTRDIETNLDQWL